MAFKVNPHPLFQPVLKEGIPDPRDGLSFYERWWEEEVRRMVLGYTVQGQYISGDFYRYLNHFPIENEDDYSLPWYTDLHHEIFDILHDCEMNTGEDAIIVKSRDKGLTILGTEWISHPLCLVPNTGVLVGSADAGIVKDFWAKVTKTLSKSHPYLRPNFLSKASTTDKKGNQVVQTGYFYKDEEGKWQEGGLQSSAFLLSYYNIDDAAIGKRAVRGWYEEAPHIPNLLSILTKDKAVFKKGARKWGMRVFSGASANFTEEAADFWHMWNNNESYNLRRIFVPRSKFYAPFINIDTGESLVDEAEAHFQKEDDKLRQDRSPKGRRAYWQHRREYPARVEDAMAMSGLNNFDIDWLNEHRAKLLKTPALTNLISTYRAEWIYAPNGANTGKARLVADPMGPVKVLHKPLEGYSLDAAPDVAGIDSYDQDKALASTSAGAMVIRRRFVNTKLPYGMPIVVYKDRPELAETFYDNCLKLCVIYNCKALVEYTKIGILGHYKTAGLEHYLKERPVSADSIGTQMTNKYGVHMMEPQKRLMRERMAKDLSVNGEQIVFLDIIEDLIVFGTKNTDVGMAHGISLLHEYDVEGILPVETKDRTPAVAWENPGYWEEERPYTPADTYREQREAASTKILPGYDY